MPGTIQQIKQDLVKLETLVKDVAVEIFNTYIAYLNLLSQATRQQLILASYQICTHKYPEAFLGLSFKRRQKIQEHIKELGKQIDQLIFKPLKESQELDNEPVEEINEEILREEPELSLLRDSQKEENQEEKTNIETINEGYEIEKYIMSHPEELFSWHLYIEEGINEALIHISRQVNRYLLEAGILPNKLPAKILEMALQAEESGSVASGPPNLLNLLVESGSNSESEGGNITSITAICLRLSEIEFADPNLTVQRNQIRTLLAKLDKIREQYRKKRHEYAIAEAEAAWRSSWFDD